MISTTDNYKAASKRMPLLPVHLFTIDGYPTTFVWRKTGRVNEKAWITDIGDWGLSVDEQNGSCTIDDLTVSVLDKSGAITSSMKLLMLEGRYCTLTTGFDGLDLADYATLFTGVVNKVQSNPDGTYDIVCNDPNRLVQKIIYLQGDTKTVTVAVTTQTSGVYTTYTTVTKYDNKGAVLTTSTEQSQSVNGVVGTVTTTDAAGISSDNPHRVVGHPLDVMMDVLQNHVGLADSDINTALIFAYRDQVFAGMEFDFSIQSAPTAKDFIEQQILTPLGGYNYQDNLGRFCVGFMTPLPGTMQSVLALNEKNMTQLPQVSQSDIVNVVTHRFDKDDSDSGDYMAERNNIYASIGQDVSDLTGALADAQAAGNSSLQGQVVIESDGMRSGFQGFLLADAVAQSYFNKYGNNNLTLSPETHWPAFVLMPGEFVTLSHPLLPDRKNGVIGLAPTLFQVNSRKVNFKTLVVSLTLTDASGIQAANAHRITASSYATLYTQASATEKATLAFMTSVVGKQANGDDGVRFG